MYYYKTPVGTLKIIPHGGRVDLYLDDFCGGSYYNAIAAASDVYTKTTGCDEWDLSDCEGPMDLDEWTYQPY